MESKELFKQVSKILKDKAQTMFGGKFFTYPKDHKLGMKIPHNGSMCGNCKYLGKDHKTCLNKEWIKWNSGNNKLPFSDEDYCCDLFIPETKI